MLNRLKNLLVQPAESTVEKRNSMDMTLAVCVLLLEIARVDDEFTDEERKHVISTLRQQFSMTAQEANELITSATESREDSLDLWKFSNRVNEVFSREQKRKIMESVWRVIYADGTLNPHEDYFVHKLTRLFNLTHSEMITAKLSVLKEIKSS